jgi:hypothetical protein
MRRMAVILLLLASSSLLAACGSSKHAATATGAHTGAARSTPASASKPLSKTQAIAFARAVNLRASDVPGFKVSSEHEQETAAEKRLNHELRRCTGGALSSSKGLAEVSSNDFELKHGIVDLGVSSGVSVLQTPALAAKELAAVRSNRVRGCVTHYLDLLFKSQQYRGALVSPTSIMQGTPPAPGTTGSFGWRITVAITIRSIRIPFYIDILGFVYGPTEVTLFSVGILHPFPAAIQQRLFTLLVTRAKAHRV